MARKNTTPGKKAGTGGTTDDDTDDDDDEGGDDETPMTRAETLRLVNSAVSGQLARKLPKAIEDGVGPVMAQLTELGEKLTAAPAGKKGKGKKAKAEGDEDDEEVGDDPRLAEMSKQIATLTGKLKEQETAAQTAERERREATIAGKLKDGLTKLKVDPLRIKGALAVVRENVKVDEKTGAATWLAKRDGYDEDLEIEAGLKEWAATDEGKSYQGATGSPGGTGSRAPQAGRAPAKAGPEVKQQRLREAKVGLLGAVGEMIAGGSIAIDGAG